MDLLTRKEAAQYKPGGKMLFDRKNLDRYDENRIVCMRGRPISTGHTGRTGRLD